MSKGESGIFDGTQGRPHGDAPVRDPNGTGGQISPHPNAVPGSDSAVISDAKIAGYILSEEHPVGSNKAKVFKSALGFSQADAQNLKTQILARLPFYPAKLDKKDQYGQRYTVDMPIVGKNGKIRTIRTGWIIKTNESAPSLTTAYVL